MPRRGGGLCQGAWFLVALAGTLGAAAGCAGTRDGHGTELSDLTDVPDAIVQMRQGDCAPARCPVYGVSVFSDGTVSYDGRANVPVVGRRSAKISAGELNELISAIESMDFLDSPEHCCDCQNGPAPHLVIVDYRPGGSCDKTIVHDETCPSAPATMTRLEDIIARTTGVERWINPQLASQRAAGG